MKPFFYLFGIIVTFIYILYFLLFYDLDLIFINFTTPYIFFYAGALIFIIAAFLLFSFLGMKTDDKKPEPSKQEQPVPSSGEPVIKLINHLND